MRKVTPKEQILTAVRNSIIPKDDLPLWTVDKGVEVFEPLEDSLDIHFAKTFVGLGGKFVFCQDKADLGEQLHYVMDNEQWASVLCTTPEVQSLLESFDIGFLSDEEDLHDTVCHITQCECLVARFGSVLMSSALPSGRRGHAWPEIHVVIAYASQLKAELKDALEAVHEKYQGRMPSALSLVSGPSRTADIEKTLVMGAHGPRELYVFYVDSE